MRRRDLLVPLGTAPLVLSCERGRTATSRQLKKATVQTVVTALPATDGQGAQLSRVFPQPALGALDPFVLLDDFHVTPPAGFPTHPHRGFEAFTYMTAGAFHHRDNLGNDSVIHAGGTQRFTSGSGAYHSEMPGTEGVNSGLQLWVNLPRRLKKMDPNYAGLAAERIPVVTDRGQTIRTVIGEHAGVRSPVVLQTQVKALDVAWAVPGEMVDWIEAGWEALLYVMAGRAMVGDTPLGERQVARLGPGLLSVLGDTGTRVALLTGRPHHEPIIQRGPFVD